MAKILIVDQDQAFAQEIAQALMRYGHVCVVSARGRDALQLVEDDALDLLVLDPMLPGVSGFEICRRIRQQSELFHLPIVFLSAMSGPEEIKHGLDQGADDYIAKPCSVAEIVHRVAGVLDVSANAEFVDPVTELADNEGTRRRLQARITRGDTFALVYVELLGLRNLSREAGATGRDKVLRHLARAMNHCGEKYEDPEFFAGHMGGGFFICLVPCGEVEAFCTQLQRSWRKHLKGLYETIGLQGSPPKGPGDFLDLMICVTSRACKDPVAPKELMDTLSRIRRSVRETVGGIHLDRRHV